MATKYRQCVLKKGNLTQVSYIPEKYAEVDHILKLKGDDGWLVVFAGELVDPPDVHKQIKGHRKNTGDSLPCLRK